MNRLVHSLLLIAFLFVDVRLRADDAITYLTDSGTTRVIYGRATRIPGGWSVRVRGVGGEMDLILDESIVADVEPGKAPPVADIRTLIQSDPGAAIDRLLTMYNREPAKRDKTAELFLQALQNYMGKLNEMSRGPEFEGALKACEDLARKLERTAAQDILKDRPGGYVRRLAIQKRQTEEFYSRHIARVAIEAVQHNQATTETEANLLKSHKLDTGNVLALYGLMLYHGSLGWDNRENNNLVDFYAQGVMELATDPAMVAAAQRYSKMAEERNNRILQQGPPGPPDRPTPTPAATTAPTPGQPPVPLPPEERSYSERLTSGDFSVFSDLLGEILAGEHLEFVIGIPAFVILFWIVPRKVLRSRARKGSFPASIWEQRVRLLGIFALAGFLVSSIRLPKTRGGELCPVCKKPIDNIEDYSDFNFLVCPHCGENVTPVYNLDDYIQHLVEQVSREVGRRKGQYTESTIERDATLKLVRAMIVRGIRTRTSDLHIDVEADGAKVRSRIDGVLYDSLFLPKPAVPSIVSAIKVMAELDIAEKRMPQDGKLSIWVDKADIDVRVNTSPSMHGEKVSMRLLDSRSIQVGAADLGFEGRSLAVFEQSIRRPHGLIIVTGPSGSGKSTTLYIALNAINTGDKNIVTLEDPIEYELKGLNQMQINPAANFTFATGLRSIVRQDPDVIMVGEVRDKVTAEMAIEAAITGHLVMTTLHTIDTTTVFTRLSDMGVDSKRYASALVLVLAQRLVRINCPECKKPYHPEQKHLSALRLDQTAKDIVFLKGQGCTHCQQTGFYGRMGLFEVFAPDRQVTVLLEQNASGSKIREMARHKGMRNIREEGVHKVMRGLTTIEEVIRATT